MTRASLVLIFALSAVLGVVDTAHALVLTTQCAALRGRVFTGDVDNVRAECAAIDEDDVTTTPPIRGSAFAIANGLDGTLRHRLSLAGPAQVFNGTGLNAATATLSVSGTIAEAWDDTLDYTMAIRGLNAPRFRFTSSLGSSDVWPSADLHLSMSLSSVFGQLATDTYSYQFFDGVWRETGSSTGLIESSTTGSANALEGFVSMTTALPDTLVGELLTATYSATFTQYGTGVGSIENFGTGAVYIELPENFTFAASSRDFLSARSAVPTPEGGTGALLTTALLALGLSGGRRRGDRRHGRAHSSTGCGRGRRRTWMTPAATARSTIPCARVVRFLCFATVFFVAAWCGSARAVPLTWNYTGVVSGYSGPVEGDDGSLFAGATVSGTFTFNPTGAVDLEADPGQGRFRFPHPASSHSVTVGTMSFSATAAPEMVLSDDGSASGMILTTDVNGPTLSVTSSVDPGLTNYPDSGLISILFSNDSASVIGDPNAVPTTPPAGFPWTFTSGLLTYLMDTPGGRQGASVFFEARSLTAASVSEPATVLLLAIGLFGARRARTCRVH